MVTLGPRFVAIDATFCASLPLLLVLADELSRPVTFAVEGSCFNGDTAFDFEVNCPNLFFEKNGEGFASNKFLASIDDATLTLPSENDSPSFPLSLFMEVNDELLDFKVVSFAGNMEPAAVALATGQSFL